MTIAAQHVWRIHWKLGKHLFEENCLDVFYHHGWLIWLKLLVIKDNCRCKSLMIIDICSCTGWSAGKNCFDGKGWGQREQRESENGRLTILEKVKEED